MERRKGGEAKMFVDGMKHRLLSLGDSLSRFFGEEGEAKTMKARDIQTFTNQTL